MVPKYIILHSSATRDSDSGSWEAIRRYHTEVNGWDDIGYHYGVEEFDDGLVFVRGRSPLVMGAHCRAGGRNRDSLGVCVVGNFDYQAPDIGTYTAVVAILTSLCFTFHIHPTFVRGHREFESNKTCPGMRWDLDVLRGDIMEEIKHHRQLSHYLEL